MKKWLQQLTPREQQIFIFGSGLLLIVLLFTFVYRPTERAIRQKNQTLQTLQQQLAEMHNLRRPSGSSTPRGSIPADTTFSAWLDKQMVALKLQNAIVRAEPIDQNTITIWLENIPFDPMIDWLAKIEPQFSVVVQQIDITTKDRNSGLCNFRLTLVK